MLLERRQQRDRLRRAPDHLRPRGAAARPKRAEGVGWTSARPQTCIVLAGPVSICGDRSYSTEMAPLPAPELHNVKPSELIGGRTGALYEFQYYQAAAEALRLLHEPDLVCVYCEWHDDFVVECVEGKYRFHQVKSRGSSLGPWKILDLFGAKKAKGKGKNRKIPAANAKSIFARMLENQQSFGDRCVRFAFVSDNGSESEITDLLAAAKAAAKVDDLPGDAGATFDELQGSLVQTFPQVTPDFLFAFLQRLELYQGIGEVDRKDDTEAILAHRIVAASDADVLQSEAQKIGAELVSAVRTRSQHPIKDALPKDLQELRARKGVQIADVLRIVGLSVEGYKELREKGRDAVVALSRLQRLCRRSGIPEDMIGDLCRAKAQWHIWWHDNRDRIDDADAMTMKAQCAAVLRAHRQSGLTFAKLIDESRAIAAKFATLPASEPVSDIAVLGRIMALAVEAES